MVRRWRRLLALPWSDRWLLLNALGLLVLARLATLVLPFKWIRNLTASRATEPHLEPAGVDRLAWAVATAARIVPTANCLPQALALQVLLNRRHEPAAIRLGVLRDAAGKLHAHAWVESQDRVVIGGAGIEQLTVMTTSPQGRR